MIVCLSCHYWGDSTLLVWQRWVSLRVWWYAIVVIENITHMQQGKTRLQAAIDGTVAGGY